MHQVLQIPELQAYTSNFTNWTCYSVVVRSVDALADQQSAFLQLPRLSVIALIKEYFGKAVKIDTCGMVVGSVKALPDQQSAFLELPPL